VAGDIAWNCASQTRPIRRPRRGWRSAAVVEQDIDRPTLCARLDGAFDLGNQRGRRRSHARGRLAIDFGNRAIEGLAISREYRDRYAFCGESVAMPRPIPLLPPRMSAVFR